MNNIIMLCTLVILICITSNKAVYKFGVPILLVFIVFGMLMGSDGIGGIYFDDFNLTEQVASLGLAFIMFYGGYGTNWEVAKPVATRSVFMSTLGVVITAGLTGLFCTFVLKSTMLEGLLVGCIVASTDAASVFSILRSQKLNIKAEIASLLEIESGSNDPIAYMLTIIVITLMSGNQGNSLLMMLISQVGFGLLVGYVSSKLIVKFLRSTPFEIEGFYPIFATATALLTYAVSNYIGGNGYLSVYILGIVLGNSKIPHKKSLFHFFDGVSWLVQMGLFFLLGLLVFPSKLPTVVFSGTIISLFMIFIARPIATFSILSWFKVPIKEQLFISWVGLRGAASIAFAIVAVSSNVSTNNDIFHIIFFIALFSVSVQGSLIPKVAKKLGLINDEVPVLKTFNDYTEETSTKLIEFNINENNQWINKNIIDTNIPEEILIVMIKRGDEVIVPKGFTQIKQNDILVLSGSEASISKFVESYN